MNARSEPLAPSLPSPVALSLALAGAVGTGLLVGALGAGPIKAFSAVLAVLLVIAAVVRQDMVVVLVVFLIYSDAAVVAVESQGLPFIVGGAVPLLLAVPLAHQFMRGEPLVADGILFALVGLLLAMGVSGLLARESGIAMEGIQAFAIQGVLLYFLILNVLRSPGNLRLAGWTVLGAGAFLAVASIFQYVTKTFDRPYLGFAALDPAYIAGHTTEPRASGPVADPNYYAQLLLPALAFGLVAVLRDRVRALRWVAAGMVGMIVFAIVLTGSRGGTIAVVAMLVVMIALRFFGIAQIAAAVAVVAVALALNPSYTQRLTTTSLSGIAAPAGSTVAADSATRGRLTENLAAAHVFADHPLLGVGPGGFPFYYQEYASRIGIQVHDRERTGADAGQAPQRAAHNIVLGMAADLGIIGLVFFVLVVCMAFAGLLRARRRARAERRPELADMAGAVIVALVGYLVAGLFLSLAFERYLWLLLAMAGAVVVLSRQSDAPR
ncbi:MAG: hypothetical protein QOG42_93 [Solirubrobacteraceae bacterium]|nr:hypothetical protein [Solirubrobacteraceae bacterium]